MLKKKITKLMAIQNIDFNVARRSIMIDVRSGPGAGTDGYPSQDLRAVNFPMLVPSSSSPSSLLGPHTTPRRNARHIIEKIIG